MDKDQHKQEPEMQEIDDFLQNPDLEAFRSVVQRQNPMTEAQLFEILCNEVANMMVNRMDYLLGLMYRLDVPERKINAVLVPGYPEPANVALARLILERQKERMHSKRNYKPPIIEEGWEF
jgi:molybdopterin-biosynthesis enzyme MoeA-like protein